MIQLRTVIIIVILFFVIYLLSYILRKISEIEAVKSFFSGNKIKNIKKFIKIFLGTSFTLVFSFTLIAAIIVKISEPEFLSKFTLQLAIAGLTLGAFSIAMAALISQAGRHGIPQDAIQYRLFSEDFIVSGIYFIFAYFFSLIVDSLKNEITKLLSTVSAIYSALTIIAIIIATLRLITGMWNLVKENN